MSTSVQAAIIACTTFILAAAVASAFVVHEASRNPPRAAVPHDMPSIYMPDAEVGFVMKPRLSFRNDADTSEAYHINERGFRVASPRAEGPSQADVLIVGCS